MPVNLSSLIERGMPMNQSNRALKSNRLYSKQLKVFFTMATLYTFYFASNYNLGPATKYIQDEFQISSSSFGILFTVFTIVFAIGQFIAGFLGDRYSPKKVMFVGAIGGVVFNYFFGFSSSLTWFSIFWGFNALFLAMGWSPGCSILDRWFPQERRGLFMGLYNAFCFFGGVIVYPLAGYSIIRFGWRYAFFIPPFLLLLWAFLFLKVVSDSPGDAGFHAEWREDTADNVTKVSLQDYWKVVCHPTMNIVYLACICSQFVRWGLVNWGVKIMTEPTTAGGYGLNLVLATTLASLMHWGGMFFSIALGYISDKLFKGKRWPSASLGFFLSAAALLFLFVSGNNSLQHMPGGLWIFGTCLFIAGGCIQGIQAPIFNLPSAILGSRLGGTGAGITNGWSYIGASLSGVLLGSFLDSQGFISIFLVMSLVSVLGGILVPFAKE